MRSLLMRYATAPSLLLGLLLTAGFAMLCGVVFMIGAYIVAIGQAGRHTSKQLTFTIEGQALTVTQTPGDLSFSESVYRTLDGKLVKDPKSLHFNSGRGGEIPPAGNDEYRATGWAWSTVGFLKSAPPRSYWYLVGDGESMDASYFVGYQPLTKRVIGYIGRQGFRTTIPPAGDRFRVPPLYNGAWTPMQGSHGQEPTNYNSQLQKLFLVADDGLTAIDFAQQLVEPVPFPDKAIAVQQFDELTAVPDDRYATEQRRVVVRLPKELRVLTTEGAPLRTIPLTEPMRDAVLTLIGTTTGELILQARDVRSHYSPTRIYWIGPDGSVVRDAEVTLFEQPESSDFLSACIVTTLVPIPIALLVGVIANAATSRRTSESPDFGAALAHLFAFGWLPFLVLLIVSVALAVYVYRRQKRFGAPSAAAWAVFMLLIGPPGLIGYFLHRQWPVQTTCEHCGKVVPRNRSTCLACAVEFSPPALKGIEVFA